MTKRKAIRRSVWCLVLGLVTTWAVAWGIAAAAWKRAKPANASYGEGLSIVQPFYVEMSRSASIGRVNWYWQITRIDEPHGPRATWEAVDIEERGAQAFLDQMNSNLDLAIARYSIQRLDAAGLFFSSPIASLIGESPSCIVRALVTGWPAPCAMEAHLWRFQPLKKGQLSGDPAGSSPVWSVALALVTGTNPLARTTEPIRFPVRPLWRPVAINTVFYAALWALPLFGLPLLRRWRRVRKGRCPACAYDLKGNLAGVCPECGWKRTENVPASA